MCLRPSYKTPIYSEHDMAAVLGLRPDLCRHTLDQLGYQRPARHGHRLTAVQLVEAVQRLNQRPPAPKKSKKIKPKGGQRGR